MALPKSMSTTSGVPGNNGTASRICSSINLNVLGFKSDTRRLIVSGRDFEIVVVAGKDNLSLTGVGSTLIGGGALRTDEVSVPL